MSHYSPAQRFDQHKAGIRAAGSVLRRGLEVLIGPTQHLQQIARAEAERIEEELAELLRNDGLRVQGGSLRTVRWQAGALDWRRCVKKRNSGSRPVD